MRVTLEVDANSVTVILTEPASGYRFAGDTYPNIHEGRLKAVVDAKDWVQKYKVAGIPVDEDLNTLLGSNEKEAKS